MPYDSLLKADEISNAEIFASLKANPTGSNVEEYVAAIFAASVAEPTKVDTYVKSARVVLKLGETDGLQIGKIEYGSDETDTLTVVFERSLSETLSDALHENALHAGKRTTIEPSNPVLAAALLAASIVEFELLKSHRATYAITRQGLQLPDTAREPERDEVLAIVAVLLLSVSGAKMMDEWLALSDGWEPVLTALKNLDEKSVIKHPQGVALLKNTIANAEAKFGTKASTASAWHALFQ